MFRTIHAACRAAAGAALIALAACAPATVSTSEVAPSRAPVPTQVTVELAPDPTSARMIAALSGSLFVTSGITPPARHFSLSFQTDQPAAYVDCGRVQGSYLDPRGQESFIDYAPAGDASYTTADAEGNPLAVRHHATLDGEATVSILPAPLGSLVRVIIAYNLHLSDRRQPVDAYDQPLGEATTEQRTLRFSSTAPAEAAGDLPACASTGTLERRILEAALS